MSGSNPSLRRQSSQLNLLLLFICSLSIFSLTRFSLFFFIIIFHEAGVRAKFGQGEGSSRGEGYSIGFEDMEARLGLRTWKLDWGGPPRGTEG